MLVIKQLTAIDFHSRKKRSMEVGGCRQHSFKCVYFFVCVQQKK